MAQVLRISPQGENTSEVIALFDAVRQGRHTPAEAFARSAGMMVHEACNGFWHGRPGLELHTAGTPARTSAHLSH